MKAMRRLIRQTMMMAGAAMLLGACSAVESAERMARGEAEDGDDEAGIAWNGEAFDRISLSGSDDVEFTTGDFAVTPTGDAKAIAQLKIRVVDGELRIGRKRGSWKLGDTGHAVIKVSAPKLRAASLAGSGSATIDRMEAEKVALDIAGSGDIRIAAIDTARLSGNIAGSGSMTLAGRAQGTNISIAGSGDVNGDAFSADTVAVDIAGSGGVKLRSDGTVKANIIGSGDVRITGKAHCTSAKMGSGSLSCG